MKEDIQFLKDLQFELINQENDCQAAPRFWTVGDYRWVSCPEDSAERYSVYLPNDGESYEIDYFLKEILDKDSLSEDALEEFDDIGCADSAFDWIKEHYDDGAYLIPEREEHFIRQNTMFLTKEEAKTHIKLNHYHYTDNAHTYAMTAWRAPKVERLMKILETFEWDKLIL
ncbi:hypothetical protein D3C73_278750 [compost metagenome]